MSVSTWAAATSIGLHLAIAACVLAMPDPRDRKQPRNVPVTITTRPRTPPPTTPPPPVPEPVPVPPLLRPHPSQPKAAAVRRRIEMPPPHLPTAPAPPPRPDAAPSPPVFGVTMESITEGGSSVSADVGNTLAADPSTARRTAGPPPPVVAAPAPPEVVPPKVLRQVQAPYPRAALEAGIQGKVLLLITVDELGHVTKARVLRGLGHGLDEAALEAVKQFTFSPGTTDGRKGPMEIRYTYKFVLDE